MKINLPVTGVEKPFGSGTIVSKTDLRGILTYANDAFVALSGFSREELIGKNHNLVRHPDMPPAAFAWLWDTIKTGQPWRGIVKNRCKNGDHYWVEAFVVPVRENGKIVEYMSVRTPPSRAQVSAAESLYREINAGKPFVRPKAAGRISIKAGLIALIAGMNALLVASGLLGYYGMYGVSFGMIAAGVLLSGVLGFFLCGAIDHGLAKIIRVFDQIAEGKLGNQIEIGGRDEPGRVLTSLACMQVHLKVILDEVNLASSMLEARTAQLQKEVQQVVARSREQSDRILQISSTMEEMSASVREVADSAGAAASAADHTQEVVEGGNSQMTRSMEATSRVVQAVQSSEATITELSQSIQKIGAITQAIKEIADQTNLLALNAAIEAARAGEQGRGFAVVADEVRKLAERTAASTADITRMVEEIEHTTGDAVGSMEQAAHAVEEGLALIRASGESLREITTASGRVTSMAQHIAGAAAQQSVAGEEVAVNMEQISALCNDSTESIAQVGRATQALAGVAADLRAMVRHFDGVAG